MLDRCEDQRGMLLELLGRAAEHADTLVVEPVGSALILIGLPSVDWAVDFDAELR